MVTNPNFPPECWKSGHGSYPFSHKLGARSFVNYKSCQMWCDVDPVCAGAVVSEGSCVKLSTENTSPLLGTVIYLLFNK